MNLKSALLQIGKVAASVVLQQYLPGATGIIQEVENLLGAKTGSEKKTLAVAKAMSILETLAKAGKLDGAAPALAEVEATVEKVLAAMKTTGDLIETKSGTMDIPGVGKFEVYVVGKVG